MSNIAAPNLASKPVCITGPLEGESLAKRRLPFAKGHQYGKRCRVIPSLCIHSVSFNIACPSVRGFPERSSQMTLSCYDVIIIYLQRFGSGCVNNVYHCYLREDDNKEDAVVLRVYGDTGAGTEMDRNKEIMMMQVIGSLTHNDHKFAKSLFDSHCRKGCTLSFKLKLCYTTKGLNVSGTPLY